MAVAIDSTADSGNGWVAGTSLSWTHTTGAGLSNSIGVVLFNYSGTPSGVTWNGVAMTLVLSYTSPANFYAYTILNPPAGAKSIVVSYSDSQAFHFGVSYVLSGANQFVTPDATGTNTAASGGTLAISLTTLNDNDQVLWLAYQNSASAITAGSGTTVDGGYLSTNSYYGHNTALTTPAGATAVNLATAGSPSQWVGIAVAIAPYLTPSATVTQLVVGGGGSGGSAVTEPGGGAGEVYSGSVGIVSKFVYPITVGASDNDSVGILHTSLAGNAQAFVVGDKQGVSGNGHLAGTTTGNNGGGGGGDSANGSNGINGGLGNIRGGAGGAGTSSSISGASVTYGGGGGGPGQNFGGAGGGAGAGAGGASGAGSNATANTGSGGGGGYSAAGGTGGSGIVIISAPQGLITATGGTHTTAGGQDIWTFTASGTWVPTVKLFGGAFLLKMLLN